MDEQNPGVLEKITSMLTQVSDPILEMASEFDEGIESVCGVVQWDDLSDPNVIQIAIFTEADQERALAKMGADESGFTESIRRLRRTPPEGLLRVLVVLRSGHILVTRVGTSKQWTGMSKGGSA